MPDLLKLLVSSNFFLQDNALPNLAGCTGSARQAHITGSTCALIISAVPDSGNATPTCMPVNLAAP